MHHALMPLVLFAVANASLPSFFVADVECLLQESYECERATSVFFFLDAQMAVEYAEKHYALD